MTSEDARGVLENAQRGWNYGRGVWTQLTLGERIRAVQKLVKELQTKRDDIIQVLMYEIGKNYPDAASEFDRTMEFIKETINTIQQTTTTTTTTPEQPHWQKVSSSTTVFVKRNAFGILLALGPYNYPLNETYATIIPALLMGNVVILKIPQVGGLVHLLTFEAFQRALPKDTIHFVSGSGRTDGPATSLESGLIDGLALIGGTEAADRLVRQHPAPHRLKLFLQLEAKNMAIILPDMMMMEEETTNDDDDNNQNKKQKYALDDMVNDLISGALSYNGQRCTALKILFAPLGSGKLLAQKLSEKVAQLPMGMPWEIHPDDDDDDDSSSSGSSSSGPTTKKYEIDYMQELIEDALSKGAIMANKDGGTIIQKEYYGDDIDSSKLMVPAILYNIQPNMKLYTEEQFGPIVPIVEYKSLEEEVLKYGLEGKYGQQVSLFFTNNNKNDDDDSPREAAMIVDAFSAVFGKINLNSPCGRSPDVVPFSARRSSGMGVMSIPDALLEFSIPTVVSYKPASSEESLIQQMQEQSNFLTPL
eukprot:CAMPEP_0178922132 /NCGR_PEP_ID=MMETSP0786-20121207/15972_1 /TAXON_ID=186022 /ORGANISM="Thalassionema frauenfeldii, Strain CCMP 1798" /LENGTH=531 /DNA_ID=CAMNT_0020596439 /DNA_START=286 /DNA_END=1880 /DNA_ORIENTATION=+